MGVPMDAFQLLVAEDENQAEGLAEHLDQINNERKGVVASLVKEVKRKIKERYPTAMPSTIVLGNPQWKPSLARSGGQYMRGRIRQACFSLGS